MAMLVVTSPLLLVAALLVLALDGRPVFYRGARLGRGGKPFTMYKLRTLKTHAESQVGGELLGNRHHLKTRSGNFLRETRIDEIPQLLNVLRGDMAIIGPRPERREVYARQCVEIRGYARRFSVRPGIFGYSQVLTPHSTPKRVRAWLDNRSIARGNAPHHVLLLLFLTGKALVAEVLERMWRFVNHSLLQQRLLGRYHEQRRSTRVQTTDTVAHLGTADDKRTDVKVLDLNEVAFRARLGSDGVLKPGDRITLRIMDPKDGSVRRARVIVQKGHFRLAGKESTAVVHYTPWSDNSSYVIEQYLLQRSIARMPRRRRWFRRRVSA